MAGCALGLALAGCATLAPPPAMVRTYHDDITVGGRLSVRYPQDGKMQSVQGKFLWLQTGDRTEIELASPLGQTLARITLTPAGATLEQSGQVKAEAPDATGLTRAMLGWPLPVEGLRYWLQGYVRTLSGELLAVAVDDTQEQEGDGWRVRYVGWQALEGRACPKRIDFSRVDGAAGEVALRLVIDEWRPEAR